jgi:hypothetical protein
MMNFGFYPFLFNNPPVNTIKGFFHWKPFLSGY